MKFEWINWAKINTKKKIIQKREKMQNFFFDNTKTKMLIKKILVTIMQYYVRFNLEQKFKKNKIN